MNIYIAGAVVAAGLIALLLYLASPHQKLMRQQPPVKAIYISCAILVILAFVMLDGVFGPAISVYFLLTVIMLVWSIIPISVGYFRKQQAEAEK
tara:strand:- start:57553 stop:57834 length:282 start_codon:yes stop_codon:yes gene_type:complete